MTVGVNQRIPRDVGDERRLCRACTSSEWLKSEMARNGTAGICSFCDNEDEPGLPLHVVASFVDQAFEDHFDQTPENPSDWEFAIRGGDASNWERSGDEIQYVLQDVVGVDENVAEALRDMLADHYYDHDDAAMGTEQPFSKRSHYARKQTDGLHAHSSWLALERDLKHSRRFFSPDIKARLDFVFGSLASHTTTDAHTVVVVVGPGQAINHLFRGRPIKKQSELVEILARPERELGAPPPALARANRMNPTGVPALYGAKTPAVCLSELRQPVGREVVMARFDILRPLRLLDVDALASVRTVRECLDPAHFEECQRVEFFKSLSKRITRPVMPDDEPLEYLITQVIAEYLAVHHGLDGILYGSVQADEPRANIVLFQNAATVEPITWPAGMKAKLEAPATEDGNECIMVMREADPGDADTPTPEPVPANPALRLVHTSIQVHCIRAVACPSTSTPVENWFPTPGQTNHFTLWG
jgi:hypothetical protein